MRNDRFISNHVFGSDTKIDWSLCCTKFGPIVFKRCHVTVCLWTDRIWQDKYHGKKQKKIGIWTLVFHFCKYEYITNYCLICWVKQKGKLEREQSWDRNKHLVWHRNLLEQRKMCSSVFTRALRRDQWAQLPRMPNHPGAIFPIYIHQSKQSDEEDNCLPSSTRWVNFYVRRTKENKTGGQALRWRSKHQNGTVCIGETLNQVCVTTLCLWTLWRNLHQDSLVEMSQLFDWFYFTICPKPIFQI